MIKAQRNISFGDLLDELEDTEEYEAFTEKFKQKKTTDDCLTPPAVYEAVAGWVANEYSLDPDSFVRPFYPGGDYELYEYPVGCVVVDNPPFSILSRICRFYQRHGIRFFLFAPSLTSFNFLKISGLCVICTDCGVRYENGAVVNTAFVTNLEPQHVCRSSPELQQIVDEADKASRPHGKELPKYRYPDEVITQTMIARLSKYGVPFAISAKQATFIRMLDSQRNCGKGIYGGGLIISQAQAQAQAQAQVQAQAQAQAQVQVQAQAQAQAQADKNRYVWELSARERELVKKLNPKK